MLRLAAVILYCTLCALLCLSPARAAANTAAGNSLTDIPGLGSVTASTLPNGLTVLVAPSTASDLVTVDVWVGAGTRRETDANSGAAHFMEHLLFKGTPTRKPGEIDAAIEDLGGTFNAATSYDWAHFYVTVAAPDAPAALSVLSDAVQHASLRQADMDTERQVILSERARELSDPVQRVTQASQSLAFPGTAYGRPLLGTVSTLASLTRQTELDFYKTFYVPGNATLVLSGNLTPEDGRLMAQKAFGDWPARAVPADRPVTAATMLSSHARVLSGGTDSAWLAVSLPAPSVSDSTDPYVCDVLLTYLGQGAGSSLDTTLRRERKLVSAVNANYLTQRDRGLLTITASCKAGNLSLVQDAVLDAVRSLRDHALPADALAAAKQSLMAAYLFDAQSTSGRANALGFYNTINSYEYDTAYLDHVRSVTSAQVQDVARRYLGSAPFVVTLLPRVNPQEAKR